MLLILVIPLLYVQTPFLEVNSSRAVDSLVSCLSVTRQRHHRLSVGQAP